VFGPGHMLDLHRRADQNTRERVFAIADQFPRVATIHTSPMSNDHPRLDAFLKTEGATPASPARDLPDLILEECSGGLKQALTVGGYEADDWTRTALEAEASASKGQDMRPRMNHVYRKNSASSWPRHSPWGPEVRTGPPA
jgi:hypothetical protein